MKDQTKHCLKYTSLFLSTFAAKMVILLGACLWFDWEPDFVVYPLIFIIVSSFTWIIAAIGEMKSEVKGKLFNLESKMDEIQRDLSRNEESGMTEEEIKEKSASNAPAAKSESK